MFDRTKLKIGEYLIGKVRFTDSVIKNFIKNHTEEIRDIVTDVVIKMEDGNKNEERLPIKSTVEHKTIISDDIFKLKFKDLIRMAYYDKAAVGQMPVLEYKDGKVFYLYISNVKNLAEDGLILWDVITEAYYTEVGEFKKFVYYDDMMDICEYTNHVEDKTTLSSSTCIIPIMENTDSITRLVAAKIEEINKQ